MVKLSAHWEDYLIKIAQSNGGEAIEYLETKKMAEVCYRKGGQSEEHIYTLDQLRDGV